LDQEKLPINRKKEELFRRATEEEAIDVMSTE